MVKGAKAVELGEHISMRKGAVHTPLRTALYASACAAVLCACTPTIRVEVAPINIYAKLDADVRVRLDQAVQSEIQTHPDLF
jgi:hypothetical protein